MEPLSRTQMAAALDTIADELAQVEAIMLEASSAAASFLTESASYLTKAGGKRLRPALTILSAQIAGDAGDDVFATAAAIEVTHLATLYHDDVIDEADTRRGVASVNNRWGDKVAILAGDYLFARASSLAAEVGGEVPRVLADVIAEVVQGQVSELQSTYDPRRTERLYLETIRGKTGSLIEASTRLGASLAEGSDEVVAALRSFGAAFGLAFQIADDLLDLTATRDDLGKPPGTDLRDGVYTLPVIYAGEADPGVYEMLGGPGVDVDAVRKIVVATGSFERALQVAHDSVDAAISSLKEVPSVPARSTLETITRLVIDRIPDPR